MMRMQKVVWGAVAAGMMLALQAPAIGQGGDKAAEVLAGTRKAIGGKKLEGMKSFSVQGKIQRNLGEIQVGGDVEFLMELPDKYLRTETRTGGALAITTSLGFNGSEALNSIDVPGMAGRGGMVTMMAGPGGAMTGGPNMTPEQQAEMKTGLVRTARQDISRLMLGWFGMAHPTMEVEYIYAGEAESADGRAHVIDVKGPDNFAARLFVDQDTHLPLMLTYKAPQMRMMTGGMRIGGPGQQGQVQRQAGGQQTRELSEEEREKVREELEKLRAQAPEVVEYSLFFDDWREADGIKFPHRIQRAVAGTTDEEWTLTRPRVNPKIDAKKFKTDS